MTILIHEAGVYESVAPKINLAGVWKDVADAFVNVNGVWESIYEQHVVIPAIGSAFQGGYLVGIITYTGGDYYVIDSGSEGEMSVSFGFGASPPGPNSLFDGQENTVFLNSHNYPPATQCTAYRGGGFSDWYMPARYEDELRYRSLKPSTSANSAGTQNPYSDPPGPTYTTSNPAQTSVSAWQVGGVEALKCSAGGTASSYWTSSYTTADGFIFTNQDTGLSSGSAPSASFFLRPMRRVKVGSI